MPLLFWFFFFKSKYFAIVGKCGENSDPYLAYQYTWQNILSCSYPYWQYWYIIGNKGNLELRDIKI